MSSAGCLNGDKGERYMETEHSTGARSSKAGLSTSAWVWLAILTLLGVPALIMAAYATAKVNELENPGAAVYPHAAAVPKGYSAFPLSTGSGFFTSLPAVKYARSDHAVVAVGNAVYLIGGLSNNEAGDPIVLNKTVSYNVYNGQIEELEDMPEPRYRFAYALIDKKIYIAGGMPEYDPPNPPFATPQDSILVFNTDCTSNCWSKLANVRLSTARTDPAGGAVDGKFYIIGGYTKDYEAVLDTVEEYDPATNSVKVMDKKMNTPRGDSRAATANGVLYVVGGVNSSWSIINTVEYWDAKSGSWRYAASMSHARGDFAMDMVTNGFEQRLVAVGGEAKVGEVSQIAQNFVEEYNPQENVWVEKAPLPVASFRASAAHVGQQLYVFGGHPTCGYSTSVNETALCHTVGLDTVYGFLDVIRPALFVAVKQDGTVKADFNLVNNRRMRM